MLKEGKSCNDRNSQKDDVQGNGVGGPVVLRVLNNIIDTHLIFVEEESAAEKERASDCV